MKIWGYDDFGKRTKLCHFPLRCLLPRYNRLMHLSDKSKHLNWGKHATRTAGIRWPYTKKTDTGHIPF